MCLYIDDPVEMLGDCWQRARKNHTCYECQRTIEPGERYCRLSYAYEGSVTAHKMCAHCDAVLDLGVALTGCPRAWWYGAMYEPGSYGFVANTIEDDGHDLPHRDRLRMLRCVAAARRKWRWSDGTLMDLPFVPEDRGVTA